MGEILLAPMNASRDNPQELPVEILSYRKALVRGQDANLANFTRLQEDGFAVGICIGRVPNVAVERRIFVFGVPHSATVIEVVGE